MNKTVSRVLWILSGVILVAAGVVCITHPDVTLGGVSVLLGLAMLFSGVVDILIFSVASGFVFGSGWLLLDGILTVLLSIFILCNQVFTSLTLPFIMGMWLLVSGISHFVNSFDLRRLGAQNWIWFTVLGILLTVLGILSFSDPMIGAMTLSWIVGGILIVQGVVYILWGSTSNRFW